MATAVSLYLLLGLIAIFLGLVLAPIFPHLFSVAPGDEATASWLVALGTLIPAALETLLLKLPLARREIGVSWRQVLTQMFWPALGPALPALLVLLALRTIIAPASLPAVAATGMVSSVQHGLQQVREKYSGGSDR